MENYNIIHAIEVLDEDTTEPIQVSDVKSWLRIDSTDESDSSGLFSEDNLIQDLITTARQELEAYANISLIGRTIKVTLTNYCGNIEIPGPVVDKTKITIVDNEGSDITTAVFIGDLFPLLHFDIFNNLQSGLSTAPLLERMVLTYDVGFDEFPPSLKIQLLRRVAFLWRQRGDDTATDFKWSVQSKYNRNTWLA